MTATALLVGASHSGAGKTTVTMGLIAALRRRGHRVRALKCGPDYIDAGFHASASGEPCANIDSWAMSFGQIADIIASETAECDFLIIESAMGLFDGAATQAGRSGAAAEIAARFDIPVLMILNMAGQAQSVGAVAKGFATYDPDVRVAGVILNNVASDRHRRMAVQGLAAAGLALLGWVPRHESFSLQDRHLGLVQAREQDDLADDLHLLAEQIAETVDLAGVEAIGAKPRLAEAPPETVAVPPPGQRIALAHDDAFAFTYAHLVNGWRNNSAEIIEFSPLKDEAPPPDCDCCWLPGGYPELHAGRLAGAQAFLGGLRVFAENHPVHGECGGYMVLGQALQVADGTVHRMAGLLGHSTSFAARKLQLGYRRAELQEDCALGDAGTVIRGHEFHYSTLLERGTDAPLCSLQDAEGNEIGDGGGHRGHVTGSYFHAIAAEL